MAAAKGRPNLLTGYFILMLSSLLGHCAEQCVFRAEWQGFDWFVQTSGKATHYKKYNNNTIDIKTVIQDVVHTTTNVLSCVTADTERGSWYRYVTQNATSDTSCNEGLLGSHNNGLLHRDAATSSGTTSVQCPAELDGSDSLRYYVRSPFNFPVTECPFQLPPGSTWSVTYEETPDVVSCDTFPYDSRAFVQGGALTIDSCYQGDFQYDKPLRGTFQCVDDAGTEDGGDNTALLMYQTSNETYFYCARFSQSSGQSGHPFNISLHTASQEFPACPENAIASTSGDGNVAFHMTELQCGGRDSFFSDPKDVCTYYACDSTLKSRRLCHCGKSVPADFTVGSYNPCTAYKAQCASQGTCPPYRYIGAGRKWIYTAPASLKGLQLASIRESGLILDGQAYVCCDVQQDLRNSTVIHFQVPNDTDTQVHICSQVVILDDAILLKEAEPESLESNIVRCKERLSNIPTNRLLIQYPPSSEKCPFANGLHQLTYSVGREPDRCRDQDESLATVNSTTLSLSSCDGVIESYTCVMTLSAIVLGEADDTAGDLIVLAQNGGHSFFCGRYKVDGGVACMSLYKETLGVMACALGVTYETFGPIHSGQATSYILTAHQCDFPQSWRDTDWHIKTEGSTKYYYNYGASYVAITSSDEAMNTTAMEGSLRCLSEENDTMWYGYVTTNAGTNETYCNEGRLGNQSNGLIQISTELLLGNSTEMCPAVLQGEPLYKVFLKSPLGPVPGCPFRVPPGRVWQVTYEETPGDIRCLGDIDSVATLVDGLIQIDSCYESSAEYERPLDGNFRCIDNLEASDLHPDSAGDNMVLLFREDTEATYCARYSQNSTETNPLSLSLHVGNEDQLMCPRTATATTSQGANIAFYMKDYPCTSPDKIFSDPYNRCDYYQCLTKDTSEKKHPSCRCGKFVPDHFSLGPDIPCTGFDEACNQNTSCPYGTAYGERQWIYDAVNGPDAEFRLASFSDLGMILSASGMAGTERFTCCFFALDGDSFTISEYLVPEANDTMVTPRHRCTQHTLVNDDVILLGETLPDVNEANISDCNATLMNITSYRLLIQYPVNLTHGSCPFNEGMYSMSYSSEEGIDQCLGEDNSTAQVQENNITLQSCNTLPAVTYTCVMTLNATVLGEADDTAGDLIVLAQNGGSSFLCARYKIDEDAAYMSTYIATPGVMECALNVNYSTYGPVHDGQAVAYRITVPLDLTTTTIQTTTTLEDTTTTTMDTTTFEDTTTTLTELQCGGSDSFFSDPKDVCKYYACDSTFKSRRLCHCGKSVPADFTVGSYNPCTGYKAQCASQATCPPYQHIGAGREWIYTAPASPKGLLLASFRESGLILDGHAYLCCDVQQDLQNSTVIHFQVPNDTETTQVHICSQVVILDDAILLKEAEPELVESDIDRCKERLSNIPTNRLLIEYPPSSETCPFANGLHQLTYSVGEEPDRCRDQHESRATVDNTTLSMSSCDGVIESYTCVMTLSATVLGEADDTAGDLIVLAQNGGNSFLCGRYKVDGDVAYLSLYTDTLGVMECALGATYETFGPIHSGQATSYILTELYSRGCCEECTEDIALLVAMIVGWICFGVSLVFIVVLVIRYRIISAATKGEQDSSMSLQAVVSPDSVYAECGNGDSTGHPGPSERAAPPAEYQSIVPVLTAPSEYACLETSGPVYQNVVNVMDT